MKYVGRIRRVRMNTETMTVYLDAGARRRDIAAALHRRDPHDMQIVGELYRPFSGRGRVMSNEYKNMPIKAELERRYGSWEIDGVAVYGAPPMYHGPAALEAASLAIFRRPYRERLGRHPSIVRAARVDADGAPRPCIRCGAAAHESNHVIARAEGGADEADNLEPYCRRCHDDYHREVGEITMRSGRYRIEVLSSDLSLVYKFGDNNHDNVVPGFHGVRIHNSGPATQGAFMEESKIKFIGGELAGRERCVLWNPDCMAPSIGRCYEVFIKYDGWKDRGRPVPVVVMSEEIAAETAATGG